MTQTSSPIRINGTATVHAGTSYGPNCGAGFNRRGGVPEVKVLPADTTVTCARCVKRSS